MDIKEYRRQYYQKNKEKFKADAKRWFFIHRKDPIWVKNENLRKAEWRRKNPKYPALYFKKRYAEDINFREKIKKYVVVLVKKNPTVKYINNLKYRSRKFKAEGKLTLEEWKAILWLSDGKCGECKTTENLSIDHVIPLIKGGSNNWRNIQVLCRSCNSKKGDKITGINFFIPNLTKNHVTQVLQ